MSTFKRSTKITWATDKQIKDFLEPILSSWEANNYSQEQVLEKALLIAADAKSGELKIDNCNVYIIKLNDILLNEGIDINVPPVVHSKISSKYA